MSQPLRPLFPLFSRAALQRGPKKSRKWMYPMAEKIQRRGCSSANAAERARSCPQTLRFTGRSLHRSCFCGFFSLGGAKSTVPDCGGSAFAAKAGLWSRHEPILRFCTAISAKCVGGKGSRQGLSRPDRRPGRMLRRRKRGLLCCGVGSRHIWRKWPTVSRPQSVSLHRRSRRRPCCRRQSAEMQRRRTGRP